MVDDLPRDRATSEAPFRGAALGVPGSPALALGGPDDAYRLRSCRYGPMLYNRFDSYVGRSLDLYAEYCEAEMAVLRPLLGEGDILVEAGANIGAHSVALAKLIGATGALHAFEPQRLVFQLLCANVALNELTNVVACHAGLGREPGMAKLPAFAPTQDYNFGGVALLGHSTGEPVAIRTIDDLNLKACRLIKADVEGMEQAVLLGAEATIRRCRPILYLENDRRETSEALLRLVMGWDYRVWWDQPHLFNAKNVAGNPTDAFPGVVSRNVLCIPAAMRIGVAGRPVTAAEEWPQVGQIDPGA